MLISKLQINYDFVLAILRLEIKFFYMYILKPFVTLYYVLLLQPVQHAKNASSS